MCGWKTSWRRPAAALALVLACTGCTRHAAPSAGGAGLRLSQRNEPATLDPQLATLPDEFFILRALDEGLLVPDPAGGPPLPGAAESWELSADGLTYTFQLRVGARWSDGDPVTAADFVTSIRRALSPALAAPKAALFFPLRHARDFASGRERDFAQVGARALDDRRLALTLEAPCAEFPAIVASGPWLPIHAPTITGHGALDQRGTAWTQPGNFAGNGPFVLADWRPNEVITVRRNPAYHDAAHVQVPEIRFVAFDNGDTEERAFRAGQIDVTMAVPVSKLATYRAETPSRLHSAPLYETRYLALNPARPPLNDRRVRRALSLALDRAALAEKVLRGGQRPAYQFLPAGLGGYTPDARLGEDPAEARQLLAAAGFPGGRGFPRLELSSWTTTPELLEALQDTWRRELGIELVVAQREARTHLAALVAGDFAIALATAIPDYDGASDLLGALTTGDPGNYPRFADPAFDQLVAAGRQVADPAQRQTTYRRAEQELLEQLPLIPLYFNSRNFLVQPGVKGWRTDPLWTRFYRDLTLE